MTEMKAQHALGLNLSWPRVTTVFLIDVAVLVLAGNWPGDPDVARYVWWSGVGIAALVAITALTAYRRVPLTSALSARVLDRFADPETVLTAGCTPAVDEQRRYGREPVGIREYRGRLVAVIAVSAPAVVPSGRHHRGAASALALPVGLVAARLRQFDVRLDGIDIVSVGTRIAAGGDRGDHGDHRDHGGHEDGEDAKGTGAGGPDGFDGPASEAAQTADRGGRATWLILRMDPLRNVAAIAARDSVAATLAAAAERLANALDARQIDAHVLTAEEFAGVDTAVLAGLQPTGVRSRRRRLKQSQSDEYVTSFWVSPGDITSENLDSLWAPEATTARATVVTIRIAVAHGQTEVSVLVRYHSDGPLPKEARAGLNRLTGRQLAAVQTSLPVPARHPTPVVPARALPIGDPLAVSVEPAPPAAPAHPRVPVEATP